MLLNWEKNLVNGPRFFPAGKRFGPCFWIRVEASDRVRPFSALVTSRSTTSARGIACQAVVSLSVVAFTVLFMLALRYGESSCSASLAFDVSAGGAAVKIVSRLLS